MRHRSLWPVLAATLGLLLGCGPQPSHPPRAGAPDLAPPLAGAPRRIVPATSAAAELLVLLVEPGRIAALPEQVDDFSTVDFSAPGLAELPRFPRYLAEPLLAVRPDLVLTFTWQSQDTTALLRRQGIPVLVLESGTSYASVRATLQQLGELLSAQDRALEIVAGLDARVAALAERARARPPLRAMVYSNDGTGGWAGGARTTADALLALNGLVNAAAEAGMVGHQAADFERVLSIDPDLFVLGAPGRGTGDSATEAVLRGAAPLKELRALRADRIALIPSALLSADGPALIDAAEALERELARLFPESR